MYPSLNHEIPLVTMSEQCEKTYLLTCPDEDSNQIHKSGLHCRHENTLHLWLFKMCPVKILIKLCKRTGWSESSLRVTVWRYAFLCYGSIILLTALRWYSLSARCSTPALTDTRILLERWSFSSASSRLSSSFTRWFWNSSNILSPLENHKHTRIMANTAINGNGYTFMGGNCENYFASLLKKGSILKGKKIAPFLLF